VQDSVFLVSETLKQIKENCEAFQDIDICDKESISPADFTAAMREVAFTGLTGEITFVGNDRVCTRYTPLTSVALNFTIFQYRSSGASVQVGNFTAATNTTFNQNLLIFKTNGGKPIKSAAIGMAAAPTSSATPPQDYPQSSILSFSTSSDSSTASDNWVRTWRNFLCIYHLGSSRGHLLPHILFHPSQ
jgi:hypothetical protein